MNNQVEGATNVSLCQMLSDPCGMRLARKIKTISWCCYTCMEHSLSGAEILEVIPATSGSNRSGSKPHETAPPLIPSPMGWRQRLARTPPPMPLPHRLGLDPTNPFCPITLM